MPYVITTATEKIALLKKRIRALPGGTSAGKTVGVLENLIDASQTDTAPTLTSVVSESIPHLKKGCIRDFKNIMKGQGYWREKRWFETDKTYTFETGSQLEFFGADQAEKLRGGRRDRLFINEANNISFNAFEELEVRTKEYVFLDWNPTNEFWYYTQVQSKRNDVEELTLTYRDNEGLDPQIVASIETRKERKGWWQVYGEGQLGEIEGKIYKGWEIVDEIHHHARLERRGLDFGYTNDPSAVIDIYYYDQGYVLDEVLYEKGLSNKRIADTILAQPTKCLVIADSAEPKSVDEIKGYGVNIIAAEKGPDSVRSGIQLIQDQKISITKRSVNLIREYRNYLWETDKDGIILNVPEHEYSHSMDALRYAMTSLLKRKTFVMPPAQEPLRYYPDLNI